MNKIRFYRVSELPATVFEGGKFLECVGRRDFIILYNLAKSESYVGFLADKPDNISSKIASVIPGIRLEPADYCVTDKDYSAFSIYRKNDAPNYKFFHDVFDITGEEFVALAFVSSGLKEMNSVKSHFEKILSSKNTRETETFSKGIFSNRGNSTISRDLYHESEERLILNNVIESLNRSILSNGLAYKLFIIMPDSAELESYVNGHFLILSEYKFHKSGIEEIIASLSRKESLLFGSDYIGDFINFHGFYRLNHVLKTPLPSSGDNGINIGNFVKEGVAQTGIHAKIDHSCLNLGFIITGLPGSGKTREVMHILDSLLMRHTPVFIITPTSEWMDFALAHNMFFISLYKDNVPINFFRRPNTIETEKFYTNLAMILSSAANAGPYRNPMEKCMLNAFRKIYQDHNAPNPIKAYEEIEQSIIKYHGKRTSTGIKYTKHGENIKSSLENLRGILSRPEYSIDNGIRVEDFMEKGAIFDVSATSASTKMQLYALILNQIYSLANDFDTYGDNELRLVICLEEAQMIFGDSESPAVQDIKQRIQDFRKQGIGLILITHSANEIDVGIRRLCQNKLYLKQAPDVAITASKDLIFPYSDLDGVALKLKTLESQIGAFSYVSKAENEKRQMDTIFIKTETYENNSCDLANPIEDYMDRNNLRSPKRIVSRISLRFGNYKSINAEDMDSHYLRISLLGEEIAMVPIKKLESAQFNLIENQEYKINVLNRKGKIIREFYSSASDIMELDIREMDN